MKATFVTILLAAILALFALEAQAQPIIECPTCNPVPNSPAAVTCDITTSCITVQPQGSYYCACRAGYKADPPITGPYTQFRLPFAGQEYRVFVSPGVKCNTLCNDWQAGAAGCQEVAVKSECDK